MRRRALLGGLVLCLLAAVGAPPASAALPDNRGWELVSPVEKNGGGIAPPAESGPGTVRAATQGGAIAFASKASFAGGAGASPFSHYISSRTATGWGTQNITPAQVAGAYESTPYLAFSADLSRSLLANPTRCPAGDPCPEGFRLRDNLTGVTVASLEDPGEFQGASENLAHVVLRKGTDLYLWSPPSVTLTKLNSSPVDSLVSAEGAVSPDASRLYWIGADSNLYLRTPSGTTQIDSAQGGGGSFVAASANGTVAFFTKASHLYRYASGIATDLTVGGGVDAFLGADASGQTAYYRVGGSIWRWREGTGATQILSAFPASTLADASALTSGATADGSRLFFTTAARFPLTDTNLAPDVYQWQVQGSGSCAKAGGCVDLISSGLAGTSTFVGASADGSDVFFVTDRSLVGADPDSVDLYDARVGGGFPEPPVPPLCVGDACQVVPPAVEDPVLTTTLPGVGNPAERYRAYGSKARCPKGKVLKTVKRKGRWVQRCVGVERKSKPKPGRGR